MTEKQQGLYVFKDGKWQEIFSKSEAGDLPIATEEQLGAVKIGKGLDIDKSGILSTKTASKEAIESGVSDDEFITPKGLDESKEKIIKSVEGLVKSVNSKKPTADGNVDLGDLLTPEELEGKSEKVLEEAKEYTDTKFSEIPEIDTSELETKEDATAKLEEAKGYTDEVSSGVKSDAFKYTDAEIARIDSNSLGLPNIIKSTEEPEQPPSSDWDIWVQYEKPEGYVTLGELPVGTKVNAGLNFEGKNYMLEIASQNAYKQSETLLLLRGKQFLLKSALEGEWEDKNITRRDYQQWSIHQWLNSRNKEWFSPTTSWQKNPPEGLKYKHGFLNYFPLAIQKYMKTISIPYTLFPETGTSEALDKKTFEKLNAIAFLPSAKESGKRNDWGNIPGYDSDEHVVIEGVKNKGVAYSLIATRTIADTQSGELACIVDDKIWKYKLNIFEENHYYIDPLISFSMDTPVYKVENEEEEGESYYAIGGTQQFATPVKQMWVNILK